MHANLKFLASTVSEIRKGSQKFKSRSRDPFMTPLDQILHFFENGPCSQSLCEIWREYLHRWPIYGYFYYFADLAVKCPFPPILGRFFWGGFDPLDVVGYCRDPQKAHPWPETRVMAYRSFARDEESKKKENKKETQRFDKSNICPDHPRSATPTKVVMWGGVPNVVNHARFRQNWLRVLAPWEVKICHFPILNDMAYTTG